MLALTRRAGIVQGSQNSRRVLRWIPKYDDRHSSANPQRTHLVFLRVRALCSFVPITMQKRTVITSDSPLPSVSEASVVQRLHDHDAMITRNPLVVHYKLCQPPTDAPADESHAVWYELTDRINYLPGLRGHVRYRACFHDTPQGLQTHIYAPMGVDIRNEWSVRRGSEGLYLQERVELRCPLGMTGFIRRTLTRAHRELVARLGQTDQSWERRRDE